MKIYESDLDASHNEALRRWNTRPMPARDPQDNCYKVRHAWDLPSLALSKYSTWRRLDDEHMLTSMLNRNPLLRQREISNAVHPSEAELRGIIRYYKKDSAKTDLDSVAYTEEPMKENANVVHIIATMSDQDPPALSHSCTRAVSISTITQSRLQHYLLDSGRHSSLHVSLQVQFCCRCLVGLVIHYASNSAVGTGSW